MPVKQKIAIGAFFIILFGYFILRRWIVDLYRQVPPRPRPSHFHDDEDADIQVPLEEMEEAEHHKADPPNESDGAPPI